MNQAVKMVFTVLLLLQNLINNILHQKKETNAMAVVIKKQQKHTDNYRFVQLFKAVFEKNTAAPSTLLQLFLKTGISCPHTQVLREKLILKGFVFWCIHVDLTKR